jgi:hypothetical protein
MKIGNYWIYNTYNIDSLGNETLNSLQDSVIITKDSVINGKTYFVFEGSAFPTANPNRIIKMIARDSSGYLVHTDGKILFSSVNFTDTLRTDKDSIGVNQSSYIITYRMEQTPNQLTVPAGNFNVIDYKGTLKSLAIPATRYTHNYYAKNIGLISNSLRYVNSGGIYYERRLLRYHLN